MPQQNYLDELTPAFTPLLAIKEASRCLLCHDAPCSQACPAQTDPGKFIRSIYFRNFKGAAETIRENNALGAVCARVCPTEKLCQSGCTRAGVDTPIDIGRLQRFVTDFEQQTGMEIYQPGTKTLGKVAIIGAGPAGLQASVTLTNQGYDVTIYEKEAHPGGWLRNGIPQFRLPQSVLDAEIARIEKMGVTIKCNNEVGNTLTLEQLKAENRAVLVTVGLSSGSGLPLFEHSDVEIAVDFLQRVRQAQGDISIPQSALIIGGGDVAMDVASTLKVLGCQAVTCVAREELDEFPASEKEFASARELGLEVYLERLEEKRTILDALLEGYNDGCRKTLFTTAVYLLPLEDLRTVMVTLTSQPERTEQPVKERALAAVGLLQEAANHRGVSLKLNKKSKKG